MNPPPPTPRATTIPLSSDDGSGAGIVPRKSFSERTSAGPSSSRLHEEGVLKDSGFTFPAATAALKTSEASIATLGSGVAADEVFGGMATPIRMVSLTRGALGKTKFN